MNEKDLHITKEEKEFFEQVDIPFKRTKEDIWNSLSEEISEDESGGKSNFGKILFLIGTSVLLLLFACYGWFCFTKTETIYSGKGEFANHILPDGSEVKLNSDSKITYRPYWWKINREIQFEGEAFFEVEKGKQFTVVSSKGKTQVLGTSFNIYSRRKEYKVYCATGKVKVTNQETGANTILKPSMTAELKREIKIDKNVPLLNVVAWRDQSFFFESTYLIRVTEELERQYDVEIKLSSGVSALSYSGNFEKPKKVEDALILICETLGITFDIIDENTFVVR